MLQYSSLKGIWNDNQIIFPTMFRKIYDSNKSFCMQERDLRERLINGRLNECWELWKNKVRPEIRYNRSKKYSSEEFIHQRDQEYSRRAENWSLLLDRLLCGEGIIPNSHIIDVGASEGYEVANQKFNVTCLEPSNLLCKKGKNKFEHMNFMTGTSDRLPIKNHCIDVYLSLRTWCIAGVLADESMEEAKRILKPNGLIIISLPMRFKSEERTLEQSIEDRINPISEWVFNILNKDMQYVKTYGAPEDFFMYGRLK